MHSVSIPKRSELEEAVPSYRRDIVFSGEDKEENCLGSFLERLPTAKGRYLLPSREIGIIFLSPRSHLVVRYKPPERRIVVSLTASF